MTQSTSLSDVREYLAKLNHDSVVQNMLSKPKYNPTPGADVPLNDIIGNSSHGPAVYTTAQAIASSAGYRKMICNSKAMREYAETVGNAISQDDIPGLIEFTTDLVSARRPMLVGRQLVRYRPMRGPLEKFMVAAKGKTSKSARGEANYASKGGRISYREIKITDTVETSDSVDLQHKEDTQGVAVSEAAQELSKIHDEEVSRLCVDTVTKIPTGGTNSTADLSGNVIARGAFTKTASAALDADGIIEGHGTALAENIYPDTMLMNAATHTLLMKDESFQDADIFRSYADYDNGRLMRFMGMDVFVSNQIDSNISNVNKKVWLFERNECVIFGVRRDKLMVTYEDRPNLADGILYSTRYGFAHRSPDRMVVLTGG